MPTSHMLTLRIARRYCWEVSGAKPFGGSLDGGGIGVHDGGVKMQAGGLGY